ncbi:hypothetical protein FACS1894125_6030 [Actinomycetota bacterium]|nr:hypothetical protein FACS1894125_6030 [Actinomycetota bacterium]
MSENNVYPPDEGGQSLDVPVENVSYQQNVKQQYLPEQVVMPPIDAPTEHQVQVQPPQQPNLQYAQASGSQYTEPDAIMQESQFHQPQVQTQPDLQKAYTVNPVYPQQSQDLQQHYIPVPQAHSQQHVQQPQEHFETPQPVITQPQYEQPVHENPHQVQQVYEVQQHQVQPQLVQQPEIHTQQVSQSAINTTIPLSDLQVGMDYQAQDVDYQRAAAAAQAQQTQTNTASNLEPVLDPSTGVPSVFDEQVQPDPVVQQSSQLEVVHTPIVQEQPVQQSQSLPIASTQTIPNYNYTNSSIDQGNRIEDESIHISQHIGKTTGQVLRRRILLTLFVIILLVLFAFVVLYSVSSIPHPAFLTPVFNYIDSFLGV